MKQPSLRAHGIVERRLGVRRRRDEATLALGLAAPRPPHKAGYQLLEDGGDARPGEGSVW
jgi:hypothetical protein